MSALPWCADWDPQWIVYEDDDVIVVHKPVGVPSQAADSGGFDDVPSRLRRHLQARDGGEVYLGSHQRLDQATSGLLLYTKRKSANAEIAAAFEQRRVEKVYYALVTGWRGGPRTLKHYVAPLRGAAVGGPRVAVAAHGGELAITHVTPLRSQGDRTLLELRLETGRTHQARVQLHAAGAPIVGDAWYGGAPASRLCLHAARLSWPRRGAPGGKLAASSEMPREFERLLAAGSSSAAVYDDPLWLRERLAEAAHARYALARWDLQPEAERTTAFRLVHADGDGLPELVVDVYGGYAVAQFYGQDGVFAKPERMEAVLDALAEMFDGVYKVVRPKQANELVSTRREELAPRHAVRGVDAPTPFVVSERGMPFEVRFGDGLATGVYLDQRDNRAFVRQVAAGKRVLNLFSYTSLFSVAAALGGAHSTTSVDATVAALERARDNFLCAGVWDDQRHKLIAEDVFAWLTRTQRRGEQFDLIVCDPPAYSNTKKKRFSTADGGWVELMQLCLGVLAPGGTLLAFTNHRKTSRARFRRHLLQGAEQSEVALEALRDRPAASDFPPPFGEEAHLKGVLVVRAAAGHSAGAARQGERSRRVSPAAPRPVSGARPAAGRGGGRAAPAPRPERAGGGAAAPGKASARPPRGGGGGRRGR